MSRTFRETRTIPPEVLDQMEAAGRNGDMAGWSLPVIEAMNDAMETVKRQMLVRGLTPNPGKFSFSIVFEAEGVSA